MANILNKIPVRRLVLSAFIAFISYLFIPVIVSRYNDTRSLRDARLIRAVKFGDQNNEFNGKVNATATLLGTFAAHNYRMKISGAELVEGRRDLYQKYLERYLDLDASVWWWPGEFMREADALRLLSPDEMKQLNDAIRDYNKSVLATMNQIIILNRFLDSPEYKVDEKSKKKTSELEAVMNKEFAAQHDIRNDLVKKVTALFADSNFRTRWPDMLRL